jgi:hypothetical protein
MAGLADGRLAGADEGLKLVAAGATAISKERHDGSQTNGLTWAYALAGGVNASVVARCASMPENTVSGRLRSLLVVPTDGTGRRLRLVRPGQSAQTGGKLRGHLRNLGLPSTQVTAKAEDDAMQISNSRFTISRDDLLGCRAAILGLDLIENCGNDLLETIRRRCNGCASREACELDLERDPNDPVWASYCPNSATFLALAKG